MGDVRVFQVQFHSKKTRKHFLDLILEYYFSVVDGCSDNIPGFHGFGFQHVAVLRARGWAHRPLPAVAGPDVGTAVGVAAVCAVVPPDAAGRRDGRVRDQLRPHRPEPLPLPSHGQLLALLRITGEYYHSRIHICSFIYLSTYLVSIYASICLFIYISIYLFNNNKIYLYFFILNTQNWI